MTHDQLVEKAANFLKYKKNCSVVLTELCAGTTGGEIPDVIGWKGYRSYLIECKTSRSDFFSDRKKLFRKCGDNHPEYHKYGMGFYRYYFMPVGIVAPEEIPENWGLVYLDGRSYREEIVCDHWLHKKPRTNEPTMESLKNEITMLTSALRRVSQEGKCKYLK